jgi:hypothetical protein
MSNASAEDSGLYNFRAATLFKLGELYTLLPLILAALHRRLA